jgi:hypothetical protein
MAEEQRVSLEVERLRAEASWRADRADYMSLSVAAAIAFHQAHGNTKAIVTFEDYNDALNIAACALSRLIPILTLKTPREGRTAISIDLAHQRFSFGATRLVGNDGTTLTDLSVRRADLLAALKLIKRAGLPFSFAFVPAEKKREDAPEGSPPPKTRRTDDQR